jgi:hypothetical protein
MAKQKSIYLSAAAHAHDNPTKCPGKCGENVHCSAYMDIVERRLKEHDVLVYRGYRKEVGSPALIKRIKEANALGCDLYYVAHTNATGKKNAKAHYTMTLCWDDAKSKARAAVIGKYCKSVTPHKVEARPALMEIRDTAMPCLYDELFFHDNEEDCKWFHNGGMEIMAEERVQALCELLDVPYKAKGGKTEAPKPAAKPATKPAEKAKPKAGDVVKLENDKLYPSSTGEKCITRTGTFYLYDGKKVNGRYRVTNSKDKVGKTPVASNVSGWVVL